MSPNHGQQDNTVLRLEEVSRIYRTSGTFLSAGKEQVVALNKVSFSVKAGEIFGLVGESGSGKTTAGRLIVGLEKPDAGRIWLGGEEVGGLTEKQFKQFRKKVQMVFQDPYQSLNPQRSIFDSVAEPLITNKLGDAAQREAMVLQALDLVGLTPAADYAFRFPHQLSGGQRQRVAIARAMVVEPNCLVADEPTSMLDASYSAKIFEIVKGIRSRVGAGIVFITHSLAAARYLCDYIAVIYRGNLMETGPAAQVIGDPRHPYSQALLDATPKFGDCGPAGSFDTLLPAERKTDNTVGCAFFARCKPANRSQCGALRPELREVAPGRMVACHFVSPGQGRPAQGDECRIGG